jgi:hypothetical protein
MKIIAITLQDHLLDQSIKEKMTLFTRCQQEMMVDMFYKLIVLDDLNSLSIDDYLREVDIVLIQRSGDVILDANLFWKKMISLPDDVYSIGDIHNCLIVKNKGYKNIDFDDSWKDARCYLEPGSNPTLFSNCLRSLTIDGELNDIQNTVINLIKQELSYTKISVENWNTIPTNFPSNLIISPAMGFMGESMAWYNDAKKIIFYDINPSNIAFKKALYREFDGKDYRSFYENYAVENNLSIERNADTINIVLDNELIVHHDMVLKNWDYFKSLEKEYVLGDIFDTIDTLLDKMCGWTILHTSTVLGYYPPSHILHDIEHFKVIEDKINARVAETNSLWYGTRLIDRSLVT